MQRPRTRTWIISWAQVPPRIRRSFQEAQSQSVQSPAERQEKLGVCQTADVRGGNTCRLNSGELT